MENREADSKFFPVMQKISLFIVFVFVAVFFAVRFEFAQAPKNLEISKQTSYTVKMKITSAAFHNSESIPGKYTCDGGNINPPFLFADIPSTAKSLAFIMEDPDVPRTLRSDGMFDHLVMWNIPPETKIIEEGALPAGIFGKNTAGTEKYIGPCPPDMEHRYFFKLFALDGDISIPAGSTKEELFRAMEGRIIEKAELVGTYNRTR